MDGLDAGFLQLEWVCVSAVMRSAPVRVEIRVFDYPETGTLSGCTLPAVGTAILTGRESVGGRRR